MMRCPPEVIRACVEFAGDDALLLTCNELLRMYDPPIIYARHFLTTNEESTPGGTRWTRSILDVFEQHKKFHILMQTCPFELFAVKPTDQPPQLLRQVSRIYHTQRFAARAIFDFTPDQQRAFVDGCVFVKMIDCSAHSAMAVAINAALASSNLMVGACVALVSGSFYALLRMSRKKDFDWWRFVRIMAAVCTPYTRLKLCNYFSNRCNSMPSMRMTSAILSILEPAEAIGWLQLRTWQEVSRAMAKCWILQPQAGVLLLKQNVVCRHVLEAEPTQFWQTCSTNHKLICDVWKLGVMSPELQRRLEVGMFTSSKQDCLEAFDLNLISRWVNYAPHELTRWTAACIFNNTRQADVTQCWRLLRLQAVPFFPDDLINQAIAHHWWGLRTVLDEQQRFQKAARLDWQLRAKTQIKRK